VPVPDLLVMTALGCATIVSAVIAVMHKDLIRSVTAYAVSSVCLAAIFYLLASPFAAALELTVGAGLVAVLFLVALILAGGEAGEAGT
jgi:NADH:ubiquinone oxidoreductase subunit 6 (subunit J)